MSGLDSLPSELVGLVCSFLTLPDLKAFRCTGKAYAAVGEGILFEDFDFALFPSHHRLYQLEQLAAHPTIAPRLKCLTCVSGVQLEYADFRYWQANVYQRLSNDRSNSLASGNISKADYTEFHAALQARFTPDMAVRYDLYRWHLDHEASMMAEPRVRDMLLRIMNTLSRNNARLKLKTIMSEPQIELQDLENFNAEEYSYGPEHIKDPDPSQRVVNRRNNTLTHFAQFLHAASLSSLQITDLSAIGLPHHLFTVRDNSATFKILLSAFKPLHHLTLKLSFLPHSDWLHRGWGQWQGSGKHFPNRLLAQLLNSPESLESLHLEFHESLDSLSYAFFALFNGHDPARFQANPPPPHRWLATVRSLSLCGLNCSWLDLRSLLLAAAGQLTELTLRRCRLETHSMIDVLEFLPRLSLQRLSLQGLWRVDDDGGVWHSHDEIDFTDCVAATTYEGPYVRQGLRVRIEEFALHGGICPLPRWEGPAVGEHPASVRRRMGLLWEHLGDTSWHYVPANVDEW